jgi:hypothetical protein
MLLGRPDAGLEDAGRRMIDNFAIAVTHGLMLLIAWRLLSRPDLDDDSARPGERKDWLGHGRRAEADEDA